LFGLKFLSKKVLGVSIACLIVFVMIISAVMALWSEDEPAYQTVSVTEMADKVKNIKKQGGTIEFSQDEINSAMAFYCEKKLQSVPYFTELASKLGKNKIEIFVGGTIGQKIKFQLYSEGYLFYSDGSIVYIPEKFKIGKISLPKGLVLNKLSKIGAIADKGITLEGDTLILTNEIFPFKIIAFSVKPDKMTFEVKKDEKASNSKSTAGGANSPGQGGSSSQIDSEATKALLRTVYSQLGTVYTNVKTVQEKQIVGSMMTVVNNLTQNPSSPYRDQAGRVIAEYNKLTAEEKSDLKLAMLTYMDTDVALELKDLFGL
jgi:uncharacterized protein YpmS